MRILAQKQFKTEILCDFYASFCPRTIKIWFYPSNVVKFDMVDGFSSKIITAVDWFRCHNFHQTVEKLIYIEQYGWFYCTNHAEAIIFRLKMSLEPKFTFVMSFTVHSFGTLWKVFFLMVYSSSFFQCIKLKFNDISISDSFFREFWKCDFNYNQQVHSIWK